MAFKNTIPFPDLYDVNMSVERKARSANSTALSGRIYPNQKWTYTRRTFTCSWRVKSFVELRLFMSFWEVMKMNHTFRVKDQLDYRSHDGEETVPIANDDQLIALGDGVETVFQMVKRSDYSTEQYVQIIYAPVSGTVLIAIDGVAQVEGVDYTIDYTTGIITFTVAPGSGLNITTGFEYDVKCRFQKEMLNYSFSTNQIGNIEVFELVENPE